MYRSRSRGVGSSSFRPRPPPPPGPPGPGEEGEGPWLGVGAGRGRGNGRGVGSDLNRGRGTRGDEHMAGALEDTQLGIRWPRRAQFCGLDGVSRAGVECGLQASGSWATLNFSRGLSMVGAWPRSSQGESLRPEGGRL